MPFVSTPNSGQTLGGTRDQMRENTDLLRSTLAVDHVDVNAASNVGKHKFGHFIDASADIPTTIAGESVLFNLPDLQGGAKPQLIFSTDNNATQYQLTTISQTVNSINTFGTLLPNYPKASDGTPAGNTFSAGWTFLPGLRTAGKGGLIMQYGTFLPLFGLNIGIFAVPFCVKFIGNPFMIQLTLISKAGGTSTERTISVISGTANSNEFQYNLAGGGTPNYLGFYWMAIGIGDTA